MHLFLHQLEYRKVVRNKKLREDVMRLGGERMRDLGLDGFASRPDIEDLLVPFRGSFYRVTMINGVPVIERVVKFYT